ncbi:hypothetical protein K488DRAFT_81181 [Vararia minispora EC-137]|uniref:Uncharacterized protein n=1 Tax=Vararia minispora EC-137 TaxID=1314806 RepID=A0ACB8Q6Q9_9AGAM|nr:hypothetical protein K488DRAFT_81181 [Vararia minispora EC-137]
MVRFKNRWILVEFLSASDAEPTTELSSQAIFQALRQSVITHFGDTGWGAVGSSMSVKYFSPTTNLCIIRVGRDPHKIAWGAVCLLADVDGRVVIPNVVHVSGTIKHAQLAAIEHNRAVIARYRARAKTPAAYRDSYEEFLETSTREITTLQD